ncbi:MAG: hypothetical protein JWO54_299 [Candidatus Saccharibacteria bacterium]|nr:hypothetical protein [Candidatus Saccharibacteria bacterium]
MVPKMNENRNEVTTQKRALAYLRISSERQINGESSDTQRHSIQNYAEQNNIVIVKTFYDEAKSGKNTERDELKNMLIYAKANRNQIDHVIVYKMSRASRDMETYITGFFIPLKALGITIRSATEPIDDSAFGQFMEGMNVLVAQLDNHNKRDFTLDNMTQLSQQGWWQGPAPIGYSTYKMMNGGGKLRPTVKPNHMSSTVKIVLERFSEGDMTKAELTRYADSVGLRSRYGNKLSEDSINRLIKTPLYAGYVANKQTGWSLVEGKHEAIISTETYEINQSLLYGKRKRIGEVRPKLNSDYPLKGLVLCPNCMNPLYASAPRTGSGSKSPRYHCSRKTCKGLYKSIKASEMHDAFDAMLEKLVPDDRLVALYKEVLVTEATNQLGSVNAKLKGVRRQLDGVAEHRLSAIKKFNSGELEYSEKTDLMRAYDDEKSELIVQLGQYEQQQNIQELDIDIALQVMRNINQQWLIASLPVKQRFQSLLFPGGLVYDYEKHRFGTTRISPLYRLTANKKDSELPSKSFLVAGVGFEPTTLWL